MDIHKSIKAATALAKDGLYDESIALLKIVIIEMQRVGGFSKSNYTKIIPYFQKADRYQEGISYSENRIIGAIEADCQIAFGHKCNEVQQAFKSLGISEIYDKLRLCAKREGNSDDEKMYGERSLEAHNTYSKLLEAGEKIELLKEYNEAITVFGSNSNV